MTRSFKFKKGTEYITLHDPDPNISPDMVMSYYSNMYPELTTATVHGPVIREDMTEYEFKDNYWNKRIKDMAKDNRKKKKSCVPLDGYQAEQLARLIIAETERKVHYGTERKKRIAAPSGAVILF